MDITNLYDHCRLCPRGCGVNRNKGEKGFCGGGNVAEVNRIALHFMEEPIISGANGSGTVFFTHCTLGCIFCQNRDISRKASKGKLLTPNQLADEYITLQEKGAHNINLVSPTHYMPTVVESVKLARDMGLTLPIVYNTGGFESEKNINLLENIVDIYLTDIKYYSPYLSGRYSGSEDYFDFCLNATNQMVKQVGTPRYSKDGMLEKGVIIRHLILPGQASDSISVLRQIAKNWGDMVLVSLMRQYTPLSPDLPDELNRTVTDEEYERVKEAFENLGLNGFMQEKDSVGSDKIPHWDF